MKISKAIETPEGTVRFEGELEAAELDYVLKVGLNVLLVQGAIKASQISEEFIPDGETLQ